MVYFFVVEIIEIIYFAVHDGQTLQARPHLGPKGLNECLVLIVLLNIVASFEMPFGD